MLNVRPPLTIKVRTGGACENGRARSRVGAIGSHDDSAVVASRVCALPELTNGSTADHVETAGVAATEIPAGATVGVCGAHPPCAAPARTVALPTMTEAAMASHELTLEAGVVEIRAETVGVWTLNELAAAVAVTVFVARTVGVCADHVAAATGATTVIALATTVGA